MPYAPDDQGAPLLPINSMAMHTQNLEPDPRATYLDRHPEARQWIDFVGGFGAMGWVGPADYAGTHPWALLCRCILL